MGSNWFVMACCPREWSLAHSRAGYCLYCSSPSACEAATGWQYCPHLASSSESYLSHLKGLGCGEEKHNYCCALIWGSVARVLPVKYNHSTFNKTCFLNVTPLEIKETGWCTYLFCTHLTWLSLRDIGLNGVFFHQRVKCRTDRVVLWFVWRLVLLRVPTYLPVCHSSESVLHPEAWLVKHDDWLSMIDFTIS